MTRRTHTLHIDEDIWQRFRQLVRIREGESSASGKIEDYMKAYINEYEGRTDADLETSTADYEALKKKHIKLAAEADKLEKRFRRIGQYDSLDGFSEKIGLERSLGNLAKLTPVMLQKWQGRKENIHQWITFLELLKQKKEVENQLEEARKAMAPKPNSNLEATASISPPNEKEHEEEDEPAEEEEEDEENYEGEYPNWRGLWRLSQGRRKPRKMAEETEEHEEELEEEESEDEAQQIAEK